MRDPTIPADGTNGNNSSLREPLRLEGIVVERGGVCLLDRISLVFEPDRRYVVVGPSGAGKSTLVRLLNRLDDPTRGRLLLGSHDFRSIPVLSLRRRVGLVFQAAPPFPGTIAENLTHGFTIRREEPPDREWVSRRLSEVGIDAASLGREAPSLSGGERQRLAIAAALASGPEILVLDEPTAALDSTTAHRLIAALNDRAKRDGLRLISVCHDREHARALADEAIVLEKGRVVDQGPVVHVLGRLADHLTTGRGPAS